MPRSKFPPADPKSVRVGPRSQRAKLLGLVQGNPAFADFQVDESLSDDDLGKAIRDHLQQSRTAQPVPRRMTIDADDNKE
jgi:hypothetical protein